MNILLKGFLLCLVFAFSAFSQEMQLRTSESSRNGKITIEITNISDKTLRIWDTTSNSWGWGNFIIEKFEEKNLVIFVRNPQEGFTANIPRYIEIPRKGTVKMQTDFADGTWVSHRIPIFSEKVHATVVILTIPETKESKEMGVWTGVITSSN